MKNVLIINFRDEEGKRDIYTSPVFNSPVALWDNDDLDNLVVDGDDKTDFFINCDMSMGEENSITEIIWDMFDPYTKQWVDELMVVWKRKFGFDLPDWSDWNKT